MRTLTRLGVAACTAALGLSVASGAVAHAQTGFLPVQEGTGYGYGSTANLNTKSTLTAIASGTSATATYTNNSGKALACFGVSATDAMIDEAVKGYTAVGNGEAMPTESDAVKAENEAAGKAGKVSMLYPGGAAFKVTGQSDESNDAMNKYYEQLALAGDKGILKPGASVTWKYDVPAGFLPKVAVLCLDNIGHGNFEDSYVEYKVAKATPGGVLGTIGSGSLGGSSNGSFGSLGSLGS